MKILLYATALLFTVSVYAGNNSKFTAGAENKKTARTSSDSRPPLSDLAKEAMKKARERMAEDYKTYTKMQADEIEDLYQEARNEIKSKKVQKSLKKLVEKYKKANRTGCILMMLAEASDGKKKEMYFQQAAKDHADCYYGDGVQVGAFALYRLACYYSKDGKKKKALELLQEIKEKYPDAIDHRGQPLSSDFE